MTTPEETKADALKFLRENIAAVVATSFNDEPRASTVYYYIDDDFNFYFITKRNTSKYINIEMNPKMAIVVGTGPEHISVQTNGVGELIVDDQERENIQARLLAIRARERIAIWPIEEMENFKDRNKVLFKFTPEKLMYMNMDSKTHPTTISEEYMEII